MYYCVILILNCETTGGNLPAFDNFLIPHFIQTDAVPVKHVPVWIRPIA